MRHEIKFALITALVTAQLLTVSCGTIAQPTIETIPASSVVEPVIPVQSSHEFTETSDVEWINSNYQKHWYQFDESVYTDMLAVLTETGVLKTGTEDKTIYLNAGGEKVVLSGMSEVPVEKFSDDNNFREKTGEKLYSYATEQERQAAIASGTDPECVFADATKTFSGTLMVDTTAVMDSYGIDYTVSNTGSITAKTHTFPSAGTSVSLDYSVDELKESSDENGNQFYAPIKDSATGHVYTTPDVLKNIFGWSVTVNTNGTVTVIIDDIYKVTDLNSFVKSQIEAEPVVTVSDNPPTAVVEPVSTPTAETPVTTAPSGKLDYSKMSQQEKEDRALADMLGMTYEDMLEAFRTSDPNGGYQGTVSRETLTPEQKARNKEIFDASGAHW